MREDNLQALSARKQPTRKDTVDQVTAQNTALVVAYLEGNADAIDIIDTSIEVARTVAVVRDLDHRFGADDHYDEIRNDCDQACDSLLEPLARAEEAALIAPHVL